MVNQKFSLDDQFLLDFPSRLKVPKEVAVVGAGRWGKIICNVLTQFTPPASKIHLLAERNYADARNWLQDNLVNGQQNTGYERIELSESFNDILHDSSIEAAFVTKMAAQHYEATRQLLLHDKHVFVEKPFVLHTREASELVQLAAEKGLVLVVGYEYMLARHIHRLSNMMAKHLADVSTIEILWEDPAKELKWGVRKQTDLSGNIITDLYPHILSQLFVLLGKENISLSSFQSSDACWEARLELLYGTTAVTVSLSKSAGESRRSIRVNSSGGEHLELDHTKEPGDLRLNGTLLPREPRWDRFPSPITSEIAYYFSQIETPNSELPTTAENSIHIVEATELADSFLEDQQTKVLRGWQLQELPEKPSENVLQILRHHMLCPLLDHGLISNPKDVEGLDRLLAHVATFVHQFSGTPWITEQEVLDQKGLTKLELSQLNGAMRDSHFLQRLMTREKSGQKC
jgi:predicted dehydrogenase